jgi:hypothetical protein
MDLSNYVIEQQGVDWSDGLRAWDRILPGEFTLWMVTRLCDLIIVDEAGVVSFVDVSAGSIERIAATREEFCDVVDLDGNAANWFAFRLVDACLEAGMELSKGRCYGLSIPSVLGGRYEVANVRSIDIVEYLRFLADVHGQIADFPDGAQVELRIVD